MNEAEYEAEYEAQRVERGFEMYRAVYGEDMPQPDPNASLYVGQMMRHLFAETWGREALSVRDRRLVIMGVLAALGQPDKVEIQFRRAHQLGELSLDELEEIVLQLVAYTGWGMMAPLSMLVPHMRAEAAAGGVSTAGELAHSGMNQSQKATIREDG
jgi:4-carboxymuconolactone decarboxylase